MIVYKLRNRRSKKFFRGNYEYDGAIGNVYTKRTAETICMYQNVLAKRKKYEIVKFRLNEDK